MKLKFKTQASQTRAVEALADCFAGQPFSSIRYRIDPGDSCQEFCRTPSAFTPPGFLVRPW